MIHTGMTPSQCKEFGKEFPQCSDLQKHVKTHTGEKSYGCKVCGKNFATSTNLKTHIKTHTEEKPYQCETCGQKFTHRTTLQNHVRTHTGEKPYNCKVCGKKFATSSNLKTHIKMHTGEKPYQCEMCGQKFTHCTTLQNHVRAHTGEKPYNCEACGKKFATSSNLKTHIRTHTGEKPYQCETCGQKFTHLTTLQNHVRTHTGEKPYRCETCGTKFTHFATLRDHGRTHTGEKPYECDVCSKMFSLHSSLKSHMRTHSGKKIYSCKRRGKQKSWKQLKGSDVDSVVKRQFGYYTRQTTRRMTLCEETSNSLEDSRPLLVNREMECPSATKILMQDIATFIDDIQFTLQTIALNVDSVSSASLLILNHPNIAVTYGVTVSTCGGMLVMEKVVTSLSRLLAELSDEVTVRERVDICHGIVCAVDYLHHHVEIVHGYINVGNVFVTSRFTAKLLDPSAAFLMHDKMRQRAESFTDDLHHLICLLIAVLYNKHPSFIYVCDRLRDMISSGPKKRERVECVSTSELLQILGELRDSKEYRDCSRKRELCED